jgi:integral membrane protein
MTRAEVSPLSTAWFKWIAYAEGASFLLLLGVGMPLKYALGMPAPVGWVGFVHGALFVLYLVAAGSMSRLEGWSLSRLALAVVASLLPFGPFVFEAKVHRTE